MGGKIQRGYGLKEKRFYLFNASRWVPFGAEPKIESNPDPRIIKNQEIAPACCHVVPILYQGIFDISIINNIVDQLRVSGSVAVPGFKAEGVVVYHPNAKQYFKVTCEKDDKPKGQE